MKKLLLTLTLFTLSNLSAQFNVNLERINLLATDQNNKDFFFKYISQQFDTNPNILDYYQLAVLYYQPINKLGSMKYNKITDSAFNTFKQLDFKIFIETYESYLKEMPANLTLLFLLSLVSNDEKSELYTKQLKQIINTLSYNKSFRNKEYLIELNSETDGLVLMKILGIDYLSFNKIESFDGVNRIYTYTKENDEISFKILNKTID